MNTNQSQTESEQARKTLLSILEDEKLAKEELKKSEERMKLALEASKSGVWEWDLITNKVQWSEENYRILGYEPNSVEPSYEHWLNRVHTDDREKANAQVVDAVEKKSDLDIEFRVLLLDGSTRWVNDRGKFSFDESGKPIKMYGIQIDITERKRVEEMLRKSEEKYRSFVQHSGEGIYLFEFDQPFFIKLPEEEQVKALYKYGYIAACNDQMAQMYGFSRGEEIVGKRLIEFHGSDDNPENIEFLRSFVRSGYRIMNALSEEFDKNGNKKYFSNNVIGIVEEGVLVRIWASQSDITERKKAEEALHESEERLRLSTELANVAVWEYSFITNNMSRSKNHDRLYGLEWQTKWEFETFLKATHPDDREYSNNIIQKSASAGGSDNYKFDFRVVHPDQSIHWLEVTGQVVERNLEGQGIIVRGTLIDITERKRAEEKLSLSEDKFSNVFHVGPVGMTITRIADGKFIDVNESFLRMFEFTREEVVGHTSIELNMLSPDERAKLIKMQLETGGLNNCELLSHSKSGRIVNLLFSSKPIELMGEACHVTTMIDITDRKKAEDSLKKSLQTTNTLYQVSKQLNFSLNIEEVGAKIIESLEKLLKWQRGSIWLMDENKKKMHLLAHSDMGLESVALEKELDRVKDIVTKPGDGISGWVALHGETIRSGKIKSDKRYIEADPKVSSELCVPIIIGGNSIGCINVESFHKDAFSEEDEKLLTTLSNLSSAAIENSQLFDKLNLELRERIKAEEGLKQSREELRRLASHLQNIREEERSAIAREIHDEIGQVLAGLKMNLTMLGREIKDTRKHVPDSKIIEEINSMNTIIDKSVQDVRKLIHKLRPEILDSLGLIEALEWQVNEFIKASEIKCSFKHKLKKLKLDKTAEIVLFRIVQESLTNITRHSKATEVTISLTKSKDQIVLKVSDNGIGISENELSKPGSFGLIGMRERVTAINGELNISGKPGKGTTIEVSLSLS